MRALRNLPHSLIRFTVNSVPTRLINSGYNAYSRFYRGQISLGLPVSRELIVIRREIRSIAVAKLALTLYHMFLGIGDSPISRERIKQVIAEELKKKRLRLTEKVILLTRRDVTRLAVQRFHIPRRHLPELLETARRRHILKESLPANPIPIYFESEIEEQGQNGRGDYEVVYYRDYTREGKEIGFRRLVSMEAVTAGDNRPSLVLIPGFANNSECFNIDNRHSMAKDLADAGYWIYLFDPRGVGVNSGRFDPLDTVDSLIDYDLAAVLRCIYRRSCSKPSILIGHSMGGLVAENMVLNWSLRRHLDQIDHLDADHKAVLDQVLPPADEARQYLSMVRGVVSFGSPKFFQKNNHLFFPITLWLNHLSRIFKFKKVPIKEISNMLTDMPIVKHAARLALNCNLGELNFLISPHNHAQDRQLIERYLKTAMESIPLGVGFQCLKAVYNGEGFKRMDDSRLNYSDCIAWFPDNIPVVHFWGTDDPLAPINNLRYRRFYPHRTKKIYYLKTPADIKKVKLSADPSQLIDVVIHGANHLDMLYGKTAVEIVIPLLKRMVDTLWGEWAYDAFLCKAG